VFVEFSVLIKVVIATVLSERNCSWVAVWSSASDVARNEVTLRRTWLLGLLELVTI